MILTGITTISFPGLGIEMNPSRVAFSVGNWNFYWYGVIIAVGFMLAVMYGLHYIQSVGITKDELIDFLIFAVPISIVGARTYYVVNNFSVYEDDLVSVFKIWEGGIAIYGAVIAAAVTAVVFCAVRHIRFGALADIGGMGLFIGQAIGRWGNFINREAFGTSTSLPWRMGLTYTNGTTIYVHPTFLYESLWNCAGFLIGHFLIRPRRKYDGQLFIFYIGWYGFGRFFIEGLRTDSLYLGSSNLRVSQLVAGICVLAAVILFIYNRVFKSHEQSGLFVNARAGLELARVEAKLQAEQVKTAVGEDIIGDLYDDEWLEEEEEDNEEEEAMRYHIEPENIDYAEGEPVVEPIDVVLYDSDDDIL